MARGAEWKARDRKTVCGPSRFISSQGQGEETFASLETGSSEKEARLARSGCLGAQRGGGERGCSTDAGQDDPHLWCPRIPITRKQWVRLRSQTLVRFQTINL